MRRGIAGKGWAGWEVPWPAVAPLSRMAQVQAGPAGRAGAGHVELGAPAQAGWTDEPPAMAIESCRRGDDGHSGFAVRTLGIEVGKMHITATGQRMAGVKSIAAQRVGVDGAMGEGADELPFARASVGLIGEEVFEAVHCRNLAGGLGGHYRSSRGTGPCAPSQGKGVFRAMMGVGGVARPLPGSGPLRPGRPKKQVYLSKMFA